MTTVVEALGVAVGVGPDLVEPLRHLPRSRRTPISTVAGVGTNAGVRELTRIAVEHTPLLGVHAGVVASERGVAAFPAVSGAGKSTLTAACTAAGFRYVCDEVLAIDRASGEVVSFPRPIAMSAASRRLLGLEDGDPGERFVDPRAWGELAEPHPGRLRTVMVPHRVRDAPASLRRLDASAVLAALLPRCFNHFRAPAESWRVLNELVAEVRGFEAVYSDARDLAELVYRIAELGGA